MLQIDTVTVTPFMQNARILSCSETGAAVIVDPGGEAEKILARVKELGVSCFQIWLTHSHLDHCGGVAPILAELGVPLVAHPGERMMRENVRAVAAMYGVPVSEWHDCPEPSITISGGERLALGNLSAEVLFTPGHSPGHVSFYFRSENVLVSGDVLFSGSIGRTDLPGGEYDTLIGSIRSQILPLPDETRVLSGHGEDTTVGRERRTNPFLKG